MRYFLLILFLGYYVSIFSFSHTHIVNGIAISHSHPYNPFSQDKPENHQHTTQGFVLIHFLSHFLTTVSFFAFFIALYITVLRKFIFKKKDENFSNIFSKYSYGLRAPPLNLHN